MGTTINRSIIHSLNISRVEYLKGNESTTIGGILWALILLIIGFVYNTGRKIYLKKRYRNIIAFLGMHSSVNVIVNKKRFNYKESTFLLTKSKGAIHIYWGYAGKPFIHEVFEYEPTTKELLDKIIKNADILSFNIVRDRLEELYPVEIAFDLDRSGFISKQGILYLIPDFKHVDLQWCFRGKVLLSWTFPYDELLGENIFEERIIETVINDINNKIKELDRS